jgi:hypothetical protein
MLVLIFDTEKLVYFSTELNAEFPICQNLTLQLPCPTASIDEPETMQTLEGPAKK